MDYSAYKFFGGALIVAVALIFAAGVINAAVDLPRVHVGAQGECLRVFVRDDQGKPVRKDCSTVDLMNDRYHLVHAMSDQEVRELMAATDE